MKQIKQGYLPFRQFQLYYRIVGEASNKTPLLVVAGGPGSAHNYLETLDAQAEQGRQVIYYDTLGTGRSDKPTDNSLWTVRYYLDELVAVRQELKLDRIHLLGHSWGGMLAVEYMLTKPEGVQSLILASTMISLPLFQQEVDGLKQQLPPATLMIMLEHERSGAKDEEYEQAYAEYRRRHVYNGQNRRDELSGPANDATYAKLWGMSEAWASGELKDFDRSDRLGEIKVPTLVTAGEFDEVTPKQTQLIHERLPGSKVVTIPGGTHCVHIEQPEVYNDAVAEFLMETEMIANPERSE